MRDENQQRKPWLGSTDRSFVLNATTLWRDFRFLEIFIPPLVFKSTSRNRAFCSCRLGLDQVAPAGSAFLTGHQDFVHARFFLKLRFLDLPPPCSLSCGKCAMTWCISYTCIACSFSTGTKVPRTDEGGRAEGVREALYRVPPAKGYHQQSGLKCNGLRPSPQGWATVGCMVSQQICRGYAELGITTIIPSP